MTGPRTLLSLLLFSLIVFAGGQRGIAAPVFQQADKGVAAPQAQRPTDLMEAKGRLHVDAPNQPLRLGEDNPVTIRLIGPPLLHLIGMQRMITAQKESPWISGGEGEMAVQHRADGSLYVNIVPVRPGKLELRFNAVFADGGVEYESVEADVVASAPPTQLKVGANGMLRNSILRLDLSQQWGRARLWITATYPGVKEPIGLQPADVQFQVATDTNEQAPIQLDRATGWVDALRIGHALIGVTYGGATQTICVNVTENAEGFDPSGCEELRDGGDKILPTQPGADAPGAFAQSVLPYTAKDGRRGRFAANDRVELVVPAGPLHVAEENEIELQVKGPSPLARVDCTTPRDLCTAWTGNFSRPTLAVQQKGDARASVSVFPMALGSVDYSFAIFFADGGVALKKVTADVAPGTAKPRSIGGTCAANSKAPLSKPVRLVLGGNPAFSYEATAPLYVEACYDGVRNPVTVPAKLVHFEARSEGGEPAVQIDPETGKATALHVGQALVQEKYEGEAENVCVVVVPGEHRSDPDLSNCRALRLRSGAPLPPLMAKVDPPNAIVSDVPPSPAMARLGMGVMGAIGGPPEMDAITAGTLSPEAHDRFEADARIEILLSGATAEFGVTTKLPIRLHGPEVLAMTLYQERTQRFSGQAPGIHEEPAFEEEAQSDKILREASGSLAIQVRALETRMAKFRIDVLFADGGVAEERFSLPVKLPSERPARLINSIEDGGPGMPVVQVTTLHLLVTPPGNARTLFPYVSFDEKTAALPLSPQDVDFSVKQAKAAPVISLDTATGTITALRLGHALVKMRFDGVESNTCVVVMADSTRGDPSNCSELQ